MPRFFKIKRLSDISTNKTVLSLENFPFSNDPLMMGLWYQPGLADQSSV